MADENELELDSSGGKKKLIVIIAIVAVLLIGGGAAAFFMLGSDEEATPADAEVALDADASTDDSAKSDDATPEGSAEIGTALYVPMPRPFRFNVPGVARDRFVEIRVQLLVRSAEHEETAKKHIPLIESTLLTVFSQSNADDLATSAGKTALKQKSLTEVHNIMKEIEGHTVVDKVLFTGFVMQ